MSTERVVTTECDVTFTVRFHLTHAELMDDPFLERSREGLERYIKAWGPPLTDVWSGGGTFRGVTSA